VIYITEDASLEKHGSFLPVACKVCSFATSVKTSKSEREQLGGKQVAFKEGKNVDCLGQTRYLGCSEISRGVVRGIPHKTLTVSP